MRTFTDGKLAVKDGRLPLDPKTGTAITGFSENWWIGLGMLHTLFALEHNAICDALKKKHPEMSDDELFGTAQLVERRADRQDPHGRVDAGDHLPPGAEDRHARQLVGAARRAAAPDGRPGRQERGAQRHPGLARGPARVAVPADRGVRLGLPPAPAAARRARGALPRGQLDDRRDGVGGDHPAERREGAGQRREVRRPLLLVRHPAPGRRLPAQLPALAAGPDPARRRPARPRRRRHHARPRAGRAALQRVPPPAAPHAGQVLRRPDRQPGVGQGARGDVRRHRARRPPDRHARRDAPQGLRLQRHGVPGLHPDGVAADQERPVPHRLLHRGVLHQDRAEVGRRQHHDHRADSATTRSWPRRSTASTTRSCPGRRAWPPREPCPPTRGSSRPRRLRPTEQDTA